MRLTTKILGFLLLSTSVAVLCLLAYAKHESNKLDIANVQLSLTQEEIKSLKASLTKQVKISDTTEEIMTNAVVKTAEITERAVEINNKVDTTSKEVNNGKINSAVASAAYVDSMWSAYCEASPSSTAKQCTSR